METVAHHNHSRGLCGKAPTTSLPRAEAEANPPRCQCCNATLVIEECTSPQMQQLGMYWLICPVCPPQEEQAVA